MKNSSTTKTTDLQQLRRKLDQLLLQHDHARKQVVEEKAHLKKAKLAVKDALHAQQLLQKVAQKVQESAHAQVTAVVEKCLQAVFGMEYGFRINFTRSRGKTEAKLVFVKNGNEADPCTEDSGGAADVTSFALRLACLLLTKPPRRRFLAVDEPFRHLDADRQKLVGELLEQLSEELGIQFLIVTHAQNLNCGKIVKL